MIGNANVVRLRRTVVGTNRNHDPIYGPAARITLRGAAIAPRTSADLRFGGRSGVITGLTLYLPPGTDIVESDGIEVDGETYEIDGAVGHWRSPLSGVGAGIEVPLRRADG